MIFKQKEKNKNDNTSNTAPEEICIDWYWQHYENGILIWEVYLFTECYEVGGGGGGGSGGGGGGGNHGNCVVNCNEVSEALGQYDEMHSGFDRTTIAHWYIPLSVTSSITSNIDWNIIQNSYFVVKCKSTSSAHCNANATIHVDNLLNNTTTFNMLQTSLFWNLSWSAGNLYPGTISNNDASFTHGDSEVSGNIYWTAKYSWLEIFNSLPTKSTESGLVLYYEVGSGPANEEKQQK